MARYDLDSLGWYNFEWLVQTWMKSEFGFSVESWGSHKDHGRDAYSKNTLVDRKSQGEWRGPVIIQAKFVSSANSLGSKFSPALKSACSTERRAIDERISKQVWKQPGTYVLISNCPVSASDRNALKKIFDGIATNEVVVLGADDMSDALDLSPEISRSFPQLLTYRNLAQAIEQAQSKGIRERSIAALAGAQDILPVFVPTTAFEKAWKIARQHSFVVLTGPPEMGKTSIGWMIAMAQLANGWQVIECREPQDVFDVYDFSAKQVFLADDAFGRTEFKPGKGELWESDLAKILQRVDNSHWLIWTSRKHILERAIREMDLTGKARQYPKPAEVLVQADKLSPKEKALILYRHAVYARLEESSKNILKSNLQSIVNDPHFTPERIRRFVKDVLPELASQASIGQLSAAAVTLEVEIAIKKYTDMMEKSFDKLSLDHKWVLVALLDDENVRTLEQLESSFTKLSPQTPTVPVARVIKELDESFLKSRLPGEDWIPGLRYPTRRLDWVHPSYRDLVIEKLSVDRDMRLRYLESGGFASISLALSQAGGSIGTRELPLLPDAESWQTLESACVQRIHEDERFIEPFLAVLESVRPRNDFVSQKVDSLVNASCIAISEVWDGRNARIPGKLVATFFEVSAKSQAEIAPPKLSASWNESSALATKGWIENDEYLAYADELADWADLVRALKENEPRFLKKINFPQAYENLLSEITIKCRQDIFNEKEFSTSDDAASETEVLKTVAGALNTLAKAIPESTDDLEELSGRLVERSDFYDGVYHELREKEKEEEAEDSEPDFDEYRHDYRSSGSEIFNLSDLFSDL